jgi:hypothetical protein
MGIYTERLPKDAIQRNRETTYAYADRNDVSPLAIRDATARAMPSQLLEHDVLWPEHRHWTHPRKSGNRASSFELSHAKRPRSRNENIYLDEALIVDDVEARVSASCVGGRVSVGIKFVTEPRHQPSSLLLVQRGDHVDVVGSAWLAVHGAGDRSADRPRHRHSIEHIRDLGQGERQCFEIGHASSSGQPSATCTDPGMAARSTVRASSRIRQRRSSSCGYRARICASARPCVSVVREETRSTF